MLYLLGRERAASNLSTLFAKAKPGDFVQMRRRSSGGPHSAIVYSVSSGGVTFLEANLDGNNAISMNYYTWNQLYQKNSKLSLYTATDYSLKQKSSPDAARNGFYLSHVSKSPAPELSDHEPYIVVLPKEPEDLARESAALHHCVVTYTNRVAKGDTYILFLRKREAPEKPFATIEVLPAGKTVWRKGADWNRPCLIQLKAANNYRAPEDARDFVRRWAAAKGIRIESMDMCAA